MAELRDLNTTDASNTARFPEGMNYSAVNDGARALEGMLARWFADTNGTVTTGGSGGTFTLTPNRTVAAYADGDVFLFEANHANTGAATLNVSSIGAKSIVRPDQSALRANDIVSGGRYAVTYDGTNFQLLGADNNQSGSFTPTLTFATPGDLSVSYAEQEANWRRDGDLVFVNIHVIATPTHTTASGALEIGTLGVAAENTDMADSVNLLSAQMSGTGVTYDTGMSYIFGYAQPGATAVKLLQGGSGKATASIDASNCGTGSQITLRIHGVYLAS